MTDPDKTQGARPGGAVGGRRFGKAGLRRVGQVLRDLRLSQGLSVRALAERSGISIAAIRALEAGQSNPSLGTVVPVVDVLGARLDRVIDEARPVQGRVVVTRHSEGDADLSAGLADPVLSASLLNLPVKSMRPSPPDSARQPSFGMVVEGAVLASIEPDPAGPGDPTDHTFPGQRVKLREGDNYHAQPGVVKSLANGGGRDARVLVVRDTRAQAQPLKP